MAKYRFEEIAYNSTEKKKPTEDDKYTYLGLEHLDSGSLNVNRFGTDVAPKGEKLIMRKGDVLFGKRRAYQKKVAIAPFDGIFSAHGMVLRPKEEVIDRDFFPLFISSDYFLDEAIKISVGSLSPTINWRDLKELEFELPGLDEQKRLAEVLRAVNDTLGAYKRLLVKTDELVKARFEEMFGAPDSNIYGFETSALKEVAIGSLSYGSTAPAIEYDGKTRYVRITDITETGSLNDDIKSAAKIDEKYILSEGDILFTRTGATVGKTFLYQRKYGRCIYAGFLIKMVPDTSKVLPEYVFHFTKSDFYNNFIISAQRVVAQPNINAQEYGDLKIIVPPLSLQTQFAAFVHQTDKSKQELKQVITDLEATYRQILSNNLT